MIVAMLVVNSVTCMCALVAAGALVNIRDEARARDNDARQEAVARLVDEARR